VARKERKAKSKREVKDKFLDDKRHAVPPLRPQNDNQADYIAALMTANQTIVLGPAGTGKTYIASTVASDLYRLGQIDKIVLTRPNVTQSKSLGFFPGTLEEKIGPWVVPFTDVIRKRLGGGAYDLALKHKAIEIVPFEVMRGRTFDKAFIILDEAQNTTPEEMKMFLSRIGKNSTVVVNGDVRQRDIKQTSGLEKVIRMVKTQGLPVPVIEFGLNDIVRSDACAMWIKAFTHEGL
jgi:phosphate starvation-inducible PhoH-like protein